MTDENPTTEMGKAEPDSSRVWSYPVTQAKRKRMNPQETHAL